MLSVMSVAGMSILLQFPHGQTRALQERTGLIGEDVDLFAGFDGGPDDAERGAIARGGERAGVAMREHGLAIGNEGGAVAADGAADCDVLFADEDRFADHASPDLF